MIEAKSGFEISIENYIKSAHTLGVLAHNVTGILVPSSTTQKWEKIMFALRIGDDRFDTLTTSDQRSAFKAKMMGFLRGSITLIDNDPELIAAMDRLKSVCDDLPADRKNQLLKKIDHLLVVTELLRDAKDLSHYSMLTRLEGQITAKLFLETLPEDYGNPLLRNRLHRTFTRLGRFSDVLDSFADFPDDFNEGLTRVQPSFTNRVALLGSSLGDCFEVIKHFKPSPNLIRHMTQRTLETLQNNPRK